MELNEYQTKAFGTCMPSSNNFSYMMLNLVGEVGEFASKVAKHIRKGEITITESQLAESYAPFTDAYEEELMKEAGDILWQLAGLCTVMGWKLEDIAWGNILKLRSRQERGVIDGNGDNR